MIECLKMAGALLVVLVGVMVAVAPCIALLSVIESRLAALPPWLATAATLFIAGAYTTLLVTALMCSGIVS